MVATYSIWMNTRTSIPPKGKTKVVGPDLDLGQEAVVEAEVGQEVAEVEVKAGFLNLKKAIKKGRKMYY